MNSIRKFMIAVFKIKELRNDFIYSFILGLVLIAIAYYFKLNFIFSNILNSLDVIISISITMAGFLITSLTILFVFPENYKIKFLKLHPTYKYVFSAFIISIILFIILALFSFVFRILIPYTPTFLISFLIILFIWAMFSLFRCLWLLGKLIDVYFTKSEGNLDENP